jgi:hypothetical protein
MYRLYEDGTLISCADSMGNPGAKGGQELGKRKKSYRLKQRHKRLIRCSALRLAVLARRPVLFCTLTFPEQIDPGTANKCFSNFVDNLKTNYKLRNYVATAELTKAGRTHFHCILDIPLRNYQDYNKAWTATFPNHFARPRNSFRTGSAKYRNPWTKDVRRVAGYIAKYITKTPGGDLYPIQYDARKYFISSEALTKPEEINYNSFIYYVTKYGSTVHVGDHFTVYRLKDFVILPEFEKVFNNDSRGHPPPAKRAPARSTNEDLSCIARRNST